MSIIPKPIASLYEGITPKELASLYKVKLSDVEDIIQKCEKEIRQYGYANGHLSIDAALDIAMMLPGKQAKECRDWIINMEKNRPRQEREEWLVQSGMPKDLAMLLFPELFKE